MIKFLTAFLFFAGALSAQTVSQRIVKIESGVSVPQSPDQFYDYWSNGVNMSATLMFPSPSEYSGFIAAEVNHFSFDDEQFFKRLNMTGTVSNITGGNTTIVQLTGGSYYHFRPYELISPFAFAGASVSYFHMSKASVQYPYKTEEQDARYKIFLSLQFGGGASYPLTDVLDAAVTLKRSFGIKRDKTVNSDFTTLEAGIVWYME